MDILVTGGEQGLGKAICSILTEQGHNVDIITGDNIMIAHKLNALKKFIDDSLDGLSYDVVINNFGVNSLSWIGETNERDEAIMACNVMAPYWVINRLVSNGCVCKVINIASQTYRIPQRTTSLYCASKAALVQMTKVMARELAPKGWVVNAFCPGKIIGTSMTEKTDAQVSELRGWGKEEADEYAKKLIPAGRFMSVEEAAEIVINIIKMGDYVNGAVIEAMGGV